MRFDLERAIFKTIRPLFAEGEADIWEKFAQRFLSAELSQVDAAVVLMRPLLARLGVDQVLCDGSKVRSAMADFDTLPKLRTRIRSRPEQEWRKSWTIMTGGFAQLRTQMSAVSKLLPVSRPGRKTELDPGEKAVACRQVEELLQEDVSDEDKMTQKKAFSRIAERNGVSATTIKRIWRERKQWMNLKSDDSIDSSSL